MSSINPKRLWAAFLELFEEDPPSDGPVYDPVHLAALVVGCFVVFGALYWLLWSLLVCEGGLFSKVVPFLQVVFTSRTLQDFGYEGYPYQLGIFEGWVVNVGALLLSIAALAGIWWLFRSTEKGRP